MCASKAKTKITENVRPSIGSGIFIYLMTRQNEIFPKLIFDEFLTKAKHSQRKQIYGIKVADLLALSKLLFNNDGNK